ncbi:MAG: hypothetical protein U9P68_05365 [Pseudomonadota bacterium]|nr:hypothetical protein [Pseudomonadota bacterium]
MSETPEPGKPGAANVWTTRIIVLVIALMCLMFAVPLVLSGVDGLIATVGAGTLPSLWLVATLLIGLALCVIGLGTAWRAFVPAPGAGKDADHG